MAGRSVGRPGGYPGNNGMMGGGGMSMGGGFGGGSNTRPIKNGGFS
jgi:hypothetical protein